jgi:hypothetical protein
MRVDKHVSKYEPVDIELVKVGVDDLAEIKTTKSVGEGLYLHHIRTRFVAGSNYTWIGKNLVAGRIMTSDGISFWQTCI